MSTSVRSADSGSFEKEHLSPKPPNSPNNSRRNDDSPSTSQRKTEIGMRIFSEAKQNPVVSGRSQDVVPLQRDCEHLLKHLQELINVQRKYKQNMADLTASRKAICKVSEALALDAQLARELGSDAASLQESKTNMLNEFTETSNAQQQAYQDKVLDYTVEWHAVVKKMMETEVNQTTAFHKTVRHYEDKVAKLKKQVDGKETHGKSPSRNQTEKLERNEAKLSEAWKEYDTSATRTANLLETTTRQGWKDLYPLLQAMVAFERDRDKTERGLWILVGKLGDRLFEKVAEIEGTMEDKTMDEK